MSLYYVTVDGTVYSVQLRSKKGSTLAFAVDGEEYAVSVEQAVKPSASRLSSTPVGAPMVRPSAPPAVSGAPNEVRSPIPGIVSDVKVDKGETVAAGATLVVIEAMKMENPIRAPRAGIVKGVHVEKGQEVGNSALLVTFED